LKVRIPDIYTAVFFKLSQIGATTAIAVVRCAAASIVCKVRRPLFALLRSSKFSRLIKLQLPALLQQL
ncbi:hypothetical protein, partial [Rheinheimera faecalis]|uniref:hypothetical protein n=1 Tax=Rheinheimera faecalis TaxID=2901141 RepID=UPI001E360BBF